jgi:tetratricopeptide (TPR) repeat protein
MNSHLFLAAALALSALAAAPAAAQSPASLSRLSLPSSGPPMFDGMLGSSIHWRHCENDRDQYTLAQAIDGCSELIETANITRSRLAPLLHMRAQHYELMGQDALAQADYQRAIALYDLVVEGDRSESAGYVARGLTHYDMHDYDRALADFNRAGELDRRAAQGMYGRGLVYFRRGDFAAALAEYDAASRYAIANQRRYSWYAHQRRKCEARAALRVELDEALDLCNRAVRNTRSAPESLISRGYYWYMTGDIDSAAVDFSRAAEIAPYRAAAIYGRGVVAVRRGRQAEGEADMARAREMDAADVAFYANAGLTP